MTYNKIWAVICFLLSVVISTMVIAHSFYFLQEIFTDYHWIFLVFALATIEMAYITLPYITLRNYGRQVWKYSAITVALFFISVIPATMQTTKDFRVQLEENVIEVPRTPVKSPLIATYNKQINDINTHIKDNSETIRLMISKNFVTKSQSLQNRNRELNRSKERLSKKQATLEEQFIKKIDKYNTSFSKYEVAEKKATINSFFDYTKLLWTLLVIFIMQLANAAFINHGSQLLIRKEPEPIVIHNESINKTDADNASPSWEDLITVDSLMDRFKVSGVGQTKAADFLNAFSIKTMSDLKSFVQYENVFKPLIRSAFTSETANALNRLCRVIKRRI